MDEFAWFMGAFRQLTGIDLTRYKRPQMERRLTNLRDRRGFSSFPAYVQALEADGTLLNELLDKMTINVSEFFRNPERWDTLRNLVCDMGATPRVWSAACATGEEPYSLVMMLSELRRMGHPVLATDIDERVLDRAAAGRYDPLQVRGLDKHYLDRYFSFDGREYQVHADVRENIRFQKHNLLEDDYPNALDLIVCRNVLIYFTDPTKQDILERFSNALKPGGILFVGSTEQFFGMKLPNLAPVAPFMYRRLS
ncbi:protein-glutamate O-methyltransferase CheR [Alicyclobacillus fastidiosus]|uniref:protein-glutamate O-methyltransferase n=1 Tax=Alicyclobacillus fastidiosus TaxID=392011 RepID=A0ABY6ZAS1_9BACL|nr:protein-glutamate O-methyltransferase CheR [Alicyclobacillus fastidiosus]WAH39633.1 protein-glutamate O-methyltransferase CheR [Alicyclobacillus fastidiosus]GMA60840.1 chemotaxis protein methyltransferase [Alicyclobacillus fastidiosus]